MTRRATAATMGDLGRSAGLREVTAEPADLDGRGIRHSEAIRDLAFACWLDAHGNADRALRLLIEACKRDQTGELPQDEASWPSSTAIRRWAKRDGWELTMIETVGAGFRQLLKLAAARLILLHAQSIDVLDEVTSPGYVPNQYDKIRVDAAKHVTSIMANVMEKLQTGQGSLASHEPPEPVAFESAAEANRYWIKRGGDE